MNIKHYVDLSEVTKVADATISDDLVNWFWDFTDEKVCKKYNKKAAWIYFIVVNGIIRKVGGTGMKLLDRMRFYASANYWTDKSGYCNAATNPIIFKYLQEGKKVEMFAIIENISPLYVDKMIGGKMRTILTNVDFRPFEKSYREDVESYNIENNIIGEDLDLDGRALQLTLISLKLKEVNVRINKRVQEGMKYIQQGKKWILTKI